MKRQSFFICVIMLAVIFSACQPTPEELIVQNKADDDLKEAIAQTSVPQSETPHNTEVFDQIARITDTTVNDIGTITINIDADVILPEISQIPVAYIESIKFEAEQLKKIVDVFYGDVTFHEIGVATKSDIEATILQMQKKLADDEALLNSDMAEATGITDLNELRSLQNERIEEQKKLLQDAPEADAAILSFDYEGGMFGGEVDIADKGITGYLDCTDIPPYRYIKCSAIGGERHWRFRTLLDNNEEIDFSSNNTEYNTAKQLAQKMIDDMEIDGIRMDEAYISKDSGRQFTVFCFERIVGEGTIDYTFYQGAEGEDNYDVPLLYEKIEVWVEGNDVVQFIWSSPIRVKEIINDNAQMQIDYEQAIELMYKQAFIKYADLWLGRLKDLVVDIDKIEFTLVRIKERNTDNYIIVPAWKFYGEIIGKLTDEEIAKGRGSSDYVSVYGAYRFPFTNNLFTINALDGSFIDMNKGY